MTTPGTIEIKPLTVGPIVGATSTNSVRLWGRGDREDAGSGLRRCFGVARLCPVGERAEVQTRFFKMNPNFDFTGVAVFHALMAETEYKYQIGWFFSDREPAELDDQMPFDWSRAQTAVFRTASDDPRAERCFVFGSCRYLLRLYGDAWLFDDRGDKTFRSIVRQIDQEGRHADALLMLGDQIYADDLDIVRADESLGQYNRRYRAAFSQPYLRELMGRMPTYMILDDHEIEDGWPARASPRDWRRKYPAAIHAYLTYQASHSPLFKIARDKPKLVGTPDKLWYTFRDGCCDFFVIDTRTERHLAEDEEHRRMVSEVQFDALSEWLTDGSDRVKLVVSSVALFPDPRREDEQQSGLDKWAGFLKQRTRLLERIREHKLRRVVFLSGDSHLSLSAELVMASDPGFKIVSVISSPFFWPYPHPRGEKFELTGKLAVLPEGAEYEVQEGGPAHSTDNFTRLTVDPERIRVQVYARKGELRGEKEHRF